ncbi:GNAT family N-acetyltransferase [Beduini massiliensis]|uniref:GNAT family N-acetyltransferase n=1 Tax=Beduini massiliensis TaxID=1585974 RepID=UPI00059A8F06|nr:GNAT family N-acetyltransferase [Beduini massiliensis]
MYTLKKQIKEDEKLRKSFNELALNTFDISFEAWYQNGFWTDRYIPYVLIEGDSVIANVSVNLIDIIDQGLNKRYVQLGTVMTKKEYRHQGLAKQLMNEVLKDWQDQCDGIYLFANENALEFYPKFSFIKAREYQYRFLVQPKTGDFHKLDMTLEKNQKLLKNYYTLGNPYSSFSMKENFGLLMFYCLDSLKECVYYSKQFDPIVIVEQLNKTLLCYDIFGKTDTPLEKIAAFFADDNHPCITLGFTPKETIGYTVVPLEENHLFVSKKMLIGWDEQKMFPLLSHA